MLTRNSESLLLCPADLRPSRDDFAVIGVFNPGVVRIRNEVVMLVRVAEKPVAQRAGFTGLPRWEATGECVIDWVCDDDLISVDPRVVRTTPEGLLRLTSVSHLRVFRKRDGSSEGWFPGPALFAELRILPATLRNDAALFADRLTAEQ